MSGIYTLPDGTQLVPAHQKLINGNGTVNTNVVGINNIGPTQQPIQVPTQATGPIIPVQVQQAQQVQSVQTENIPVQMVTMQAAQPVVQPVQAYFEAPAATPVVAPNPAPVPTSIPQAGTTTDPEKDALRKEIEAFKSNRNLEVNKLVDKAVGTPENKAVLDKWVDTNMNSFEKKVLNDVMASGTITEVQEALNAVISKYNTTVQVDTTAPQLRNQVDPNASAYNSAFSTPAVSSAVTPMGKEEFEHAIMDPRYEVDPTFTANVNQRRLMAIKTSGQAPVSPRRF